MSMIYLRAVDCQMFVAGCSPARDVNANYVAWGHSTIIDPMFAYSYTIYFCTILLGVKC